MSEDLRRSVQIKHAVFFSLAFQAHSVDPRLVFPSLIWDTRCPTPSQKLEQVRFRTKREKVWISPQFVDIHIHMYAQLFIIQPCNIGNLSNVGNLWWFYPVPPIKVIIITSFQKPCDFGINYGNPVSRTYLLWQLEKISVMSVTLVTMVTFRGVGILSLEKSSLFE